MPLINTGFLIVSASKRQILAYATAGGYGTAGSDPAAHGLDWGGDALPFLQLVAASVGLRQRTAEPLIASEDLEANAEPIRSAQRGDVVFYDYRQPKLDGNSNPALRPLREARDRGPAARCGRGGGPADRACPADSNWVADQAIGEHR